MKSPFAQEHLKQAGLALLPAIALALLPKCPLCWMAILSSLGLSSSISSAWLQPLALGFLALALGAIAIRSRRRGAYGPLILGISAAIFTYISKFTFGLDAGAYLGGAALMGASFWNSRPTPAIAESATCGCSGLKNKTLSKENL